MHPCPVAELEPAASEHTGPRKGPRHRDLVRLCQQCLAGAAPAATTFPRRKSLTGAQPRHRIDHGGRRPHLAWRSRLPGVELPASSARGEAEENLSVYTLADLQPPC